MRQLTLEQERQAAREPEDRADPEARSEPTAARVRDLAGTVAPLARVAEPAGRMLPPQPGWTVHQAENGAMGLARVDAVAPVTDGFTFPNRLRTHPAGRDVPVVVLTARDIAAGAKATLETHAARIILKGRVSCADLGRELRHIVGPDRGPPPPTHETLVTPT